MADSVVFINGPWKRQIRYFPADWISRGHIRFVNHIPQPNAYFDPNVIDNDVVEEGEYQIRKVLDSDGRTIYLGVTEVNSYEEGILSMILDEWLG